jgi:hypothetical protein
MQCLYIQTSNVQSQVLIQDFIFTLQIRAHAGFEFKFYPLTHTLLRKYRSNQWHYNYIIVL